MHTPGRLLFAIATTAALCGTAQADSPARPVALAKEYFAVFSARPFDVARLLNFYAEDVVFSDPTFDIDVTGREGVRDLYHAIGSPQSAYRDIRFDLDRIISSGDDVAIHGEWSGRFRDKPFRVQFVTLWKLRAGLIAEQKDFFDAITWDEQVGWTADQP